LISAEQHCFVKGPSTVSDFVEYSSFFLNAVEDGCQVYSFYTDFSKEFDRVQHCLLLSKKSANIESVFSLWLELNFSGRTHPIRIGDCVSRDILVTSSRSTGKPSGTL
jgi:hypothetical protein